MDRRTIELGLALPTDPRQREVCVSRLLEALREQRGVLEALVDAHQQRGPQLTVKYDALATNIAKLQHVAESAGAELPHRVAHLAADVAGIRHHRHARLAEAALARTRGVLNASVAFGTRKLYLEFDPHVLPLEALHDAINRVGVVLLTPPKRVDGLRSHERPKVGDHTPEPKTTRGLAATSGGLFGEHAELIGGFACIALALCGRAVSSAGLSSAVSAALFGGAYVLGARFIVQDLAAAVRARFLGVDILVLVAALGTAFAGAWFEGSVLLALFALSHSLESLPAWWVRRAMRTLACLMPDTALRVHASGIEEVSAASLAVGDRVLVRANERVAADGVVVGGSGWVYQSLVGDDTARAEKHPLLDVDATRIEHISAENRIIAGSLNGAGDLTIVATKVAAETALGRALAKFSELERMKSPTQWFTDRFERVLVPLAVVLSAGVCLAGLAIEEPLSRSLYRATAVLVAASPWALAMAVPSVVLAGIVRSVRAGVIMKGGTQLEALGGVGTLAFDKGTLTEGKPKLTDIRPACGTSREELLLVALAIENQSTHPIAQAIVQGAIDELGAARAAREADGVTSMAGFGIQGRVAGDLVRIGKPRLFEGDWVLPDDVERAATELQELGRTVIIVQRGESFLGVLGATDSPRSGSRRIIEQLHGLGVESTVVLTSDNRTVAATVAAQLGVRDARGDLSPEEKVAAVVELGGEAKVAMVGDVVNDHAVMTSAAIGIAMGAGGSDSAFRTADVALLGDDMQALPFAVSLGRAARRVVRQNVCASLGAVALLVPAASTDIVGIGVVAALHACTTLIVGLNALRLLAFSFRG